MASIPNLHALLIDELADLLFAEKQLVKALPKLAKAASNADLKAGFTGHLAQTRIHVERLTKALNILGSPATDKTCQAMLGLVAEIVTVGPGSEERRLRAEELAAEHGYAIMPPYNDEKIIAGQGTVGLEILGI